MSDAVRRSANGKFTAGSEAAQIGNKALESGFSLAKAAAEARKQTGQGPGPYDADWRQQRAAASAAATARWQDPQQRAAASAAASAAATARWQDPQQRPPRDESGRFKPSSS